MFSSGTEWITSESDPQWNFTIEGIVGGFVASSEMREKIEELKKKYGDPPKDLKYGYMKD